MQENDENLDSFAESNTRASNVKEKGLIQKDRKPSFTKNVKEMIAGKIKLVKSKRIDGGDGILTGPEIESVISALKSPSVRRDWYQLFTSINVKQVEASGTAPHTKSSSSSTSSSSSSSSELAQLQEKAASNRKVQETEEEAAATKTKEDREELIRRANSALVASKEFEENDYVLDDESELGEAEEAFQELEAVNRQLQQHIGHQECRNMLLLVDKMLNNFARWCFDKEFTKAFRDSKQRQRVDSSLASNKPANLSSKSRTSSISTTTSSLTAQLPLKQQLLRKQIRTLTKKLDQIIEKTDAIGNFLVEKAEEDNGKKQKNDKKRKRGQQALANNVLQGNIVDVRKAELEDEYRDLLVKLVDNRQGYLSLFETPLLAASTAFTLLLNPFGRSSLVLPANPAPQQIELELKSLAETMMSCFILKSKQTRKKQKVSYKIYGGEGEEKGKEIEENEEEEDDEEEEEEDEEDDEEED